MSLRFTEADIDRARDEWGFNCGPGALCAVLGLTPDELRPLLGDFETKRYTNPMLMFDTLKRAGATFQMVYRADEPKGLPRLKHGLMRIQWGGSWTKPGVPMRARYRQTHWVAMRSEGREIFDVNAMEAGGWIAFDRWAFQLIPWLIKECCPKGDGTWWPTHAIEVDQPKHCTNCVRGSVPNFDGEGNERGVRDCEVCHGTGLR